LVNAAEVAWHQGVDLYGYRPNLLKDAIEFHSGLLTRRPLQLTQYDADAENQQGATYLTQCEYNSTGKPAWNYAAGGYEISYRHWAGRRKLSLPATLSVVRAHAPEGFGFAWGYGTLTHALPR
jgi:hypothetical protein